MHRIALRWVPANTLSKINSESAALAECFFYSHALDPRWWLTSENLHFKSFAGAIVSANFSSDSRKIFSNFSLLKKIADFSVPFLH